MSKAIMMSIQPKWVEKILNGEKTIEVRKTAPKLETPFKVYVYCTKDREKLSIPEVIYRGKYGLFRGYDKDYTPCTLTTGEGIFTIYPLNGKVVAEFTCDRIECVKPYIDTLTQHNRYPISANKWGKTCLSYREMTDYGNGKPLYLWHISDLKIYDKPRELSDFHKPCDLCELYKDCDRVGEVDCYVHREFTRPPQSWAYCEEI